MRTLEYIRTIHKIEQLGVVARRVADEQLRAVSYDSF